MTIDETPRGSGGGGERSGMRTSAHEIERYGGLFARRTRGIAQSQFAGGMQILETMQEATQGIRIVKAFGLEDTMCARMDANVAEIERQSNKMARVASRSQPLMETLAGFAGLSIPHGDHTIPVHGGF